MEKVSDDLEARQYSSEIRLRIFVLTSKGTVDLSTSPFSRSIPGKDMRMVCVKTLHKHWRIFIPGVFRFPGGCIVEGTDLATRYDWKKSVGPVENRPLNEKIAGNIRLPTVSSLIITKATDWDFMNTSCCPKKWGRHLCRF